MKIDSSSIGMGSQHASARRVSVEESLRAWVGLKRPDFEHAAAPNRAPGLVMPPGLAMLSTRVTISNSARQAAASAPPPADAQAAEQVTDAMDEARHDPKIRLIVDLIEALTGQPVRLFRPQELQQSVPTPAELAPPVASASAAPAPAQNAPQGWGLEYDRHETVQETEQTSFSAQGVIKTADGLEIQFSLTLTMTRSFTQESTVSLRQGDGVAKDPLVINFSGVAAQLTSTRFNFDLDSDGQTEAMPFVGADSGFLVLDKNGNGAVDNGAELFGPRSGNGFADLSAYDLDRNHWIDERDAVYDQLQVWRKDAAGQDTLSGLTALQIGAIYLGHVSSPFDLRNTGNELQGKVRSSGLYLREDGSTGSVQQVDIVV
jgi:hypothetical protein